MKRRKFKEGDVLLLRLEESCYALARIYPSPRIEAYLALYLYKDIVFGLPPLEKVEEIIKNDNLHFYCNAEIYSYDKAKYINYANIPLSSKELSFEMWFFTQSIGNFKECKVARSGGYFVPAEPYQCIGMERTAMWSLDGVINRAIARKDGVKHFHEELQKVILNADDPRNTSDPSKLRFSWETGEFYLVD